MHFAPYYSAELLPRPHNWAHWQKNVFIFRVEVAAEARSLSKSARAQAKKRRLLQIIYDFAPAQLLSLDGVYFRGAFNVGALS